MLDILLLIAKNKKFIFFFTLIMSVLAVIYSLVVEEKWTSQLVVLPKDDSSSMSMLGNMMGGLGLGSSMTLSAKSNKYASLIKNKNTTEETVRKFNLIEYFKIKEKDPLKEMDVAIKAFHSAIFSVLVSLEDNFIKIEITTKDKYLSRDIAMHYLDVLSDYAQDNTNNTGRQKRELFESRIEALTEELRQVNDEMRIYQAKHNIINIEAQAIAAIESYSQVIGQLLAAGLDLKYIERFMLSGTRHTELTTRNDVISETLQKLESNTGEIPFILPLNQLNDHIFVIQDFMIRQIIMQKTLETIYPQYELARIEEVEEMDKFEIIEFPTLAGIRSFPRRSVICILVFFISFSLSAGLALAKELASDDDKEKIRAIWKTLFR